MCRLAIVSTLALLAPWGGSALATESRETLAEAVREREVAFARTMADRNHAAFVSFLAEEAIFLDFGVLRGREAVAEGWQPLFDGPTAPFSWQPERVVVVESGRLAISTGPVRNSAGERIGTFNSTWRLEEDGEWRVVLDVGCPPCRCAGAREDPPAAEATASDPGE